MSNLVENYLVFLAERNDAAIEFSGIAGGIGEQMSKMYFNCVRSKCGGVIAIKKSKRLCKTQCKLMSNKWGLAKIKAAKSICGKAKTPKDKELCMKEYGRNIQAMENEVKKAQAKLSKG